MNEFDNEPLPGLPEALPAGEHIIWQGKPAAWSVAWHLLLAPYVAAYFGALAVWSGAATLTAGEGVVATMVAALWLLGLGAIALAILAAIAWAIEKTTVYTLTNQRIVLRYGLALPMAVNIPFGQIQAAAVRNYRGGVGSISLQMTQNQGLAYLFMWPHVRPWYMWAPQPMLACIADAATVSALLGRAVSASTTGLAVQPPQAQCGHSMWRPDRGQMPGSGLGAQT